MRTYFRDRTLALKDFFIPLCESLLIDRYTPIWNKVIDGFGNKVVGAGREQEQQKSMWDVLHPGRIGAAAKTNKKYPTDGAVLDKLRKFYAGKPVRLIPTTDAVTTAEKEGESKD
jgi:Eco29kI restriction endonuclease